jgi:hypothetical protein
LRPGSAVGNRMARGGNRERWEHLRKGAGAPKAIIPAPDLVRAATIQAPGPEAIILAMGPATGRVRELAAIIPDMEARDPGQAKGATIQAQELRWNP